MSESVKIDGAPWRNYKMNRLKILFGAHRDWTRSSIPRHLKHRQTSCGLSLADKSTHQTRPSSGFAKEKSGCVFFSSWFIQSVWRNYTLLDARSVTMANATASKLPCSPFGCSYSPQVLLLEYCHKVRILRVAKSHSKFKFPSAVNFARTQLVLRLSPSDSRRTFTALCVPVPVRSSSQQSAFHASECSPKTEFQRSWLHNWNRHVSFLFSLGRSCLRRQSGSLSTAWTRNLYLAVQDIDLVSWRLYSSTLLPEHRLDVSFYVFLY